MLYWLVNFQNQPPIMKKETYWNILGKFTEAMELLRIPTGSTLNDQADKYIMGTLLKKVGPDGLSISGTRDNGKFRSFNGCGTVRFMLAMMVAYERDHNPVWLETTKKMIDRLIQLGVDKGDYAFFSQDAFMPDQKIDPSVKAPIGYFAIDCNNGRFLQAFAHYDKLVGGYEPGRKFGRKLANYLIHHSEYFGEDGSWKIDRFDPVKDPGRFEGVHFHAHTLSLIGMLEFAIVTNDQELKDYCKKSFDWAIRRNATVGARAKWPPGSASSSNSSTRCIRRLRSARWRHDHPGP